MLLNLGIVIFSCLWIGLSSFNPFGTLVLELPQPLNPSEPVLEQPYQGASSVDSIPSEKLIQFVQAYAQVVKLIEHREGELQAAEMESESQRLEREIAAEAFEIIEDVGLTRQEYWQLLGLANSDPEFGERIAEQLQEAVH